MAARIPDKHVDWKKLPADAHVTLASVGLAHVYVATLPSRRKAVVIWSGHDATEAQRWLDSRVAARPRSAGDARRTTRVLTMYRPAFVYVDGAVVFKATMTPTHGPLDAARDVSHRARTGSTIEVRQGRYSWAYRVGGPGKLKTIARGAR